MSIWQLWIDKITVSLQWVTHHFGWSDAVAIIALTVGMRLLLMPISLAAGVRMHHNKSTMARLKPEFDALQTSLKDDPVALARASMALSQRHGVTLFGKITLLNIGTQTVVALGAFQSLRKLLLPSRFLWIGSLAKPDLWLALLVGILMLLSMALVPGAAEQGSPWFRLIAIFVLVPALASLPSALGVYWVASNAMSLVQALALRRIVRPSMATTASRL